MDIDFEHSLSLGGNIWKFASYREDAAERIAALYGLPAAVAAIVAARGICVGEVDDFLYPKMQNLMPDPFCLKDMEKAALRIAGAVERGERVAVIGDYDVDGATSSSLLKLFLHSVGCEAPVHIPEREEGYGPSKTAVDEFAALGANLLITTDCGTTAFEVLEYAKNKGMDVIVLDHHEAETRLPDICAVVNPKRLDESDEYPCLKYLAAVGVVFLTVVAVNRELRKRGFYQNRPAPDLMKWLDLVALGTVCDVVPLLGLNRAFVRQGLKVMSLRQNCGLKALADKASLSEAPTSYHLGFVLGPRINAGGRVGEASTGSRLLCATDDFQAAMLADRLDGFNALRKEIEAYVLLQAIEILEGTPQPYPIAFVYGHDWHQGVIGIAASRLSEEFHLPTIMICCDGERGKGSCRSFGGFNLYNALSACSEYLEGFGGHALAAGLTIRRENIDRFRRALGEYYRQNPADDLPELTCDLRVDDPHLLTMACIESLDALEPCGNGNPKPLLCITGARLVNAVPIGGGRHLRLHFAKGGYNYAGIFFSCTPAELGVRIGQWADVAFTPQINEFRGRRSVQLLVTDVRPSDPLPLCSALLKNQCVPAWDTVDLYPLRADFAVAWRWLKAPMVFSLSELPERAPMRPEKFCVCLRVMAEMGLAAVDFDGELLRLRPLPTSGKVDLGASKLLQALRDRRQKLL